MFGTTIYKIVYLYIHIQSFYVYIRIIYLSLSNLFLYNKFILHKFLLKQFLIIENNTFKLI